MNVKVRASLRCENYPSLVSVILKEKGIEELYPYDKHYDRTDWLTRLEP